MSRYFDYVIKNTNDNRFMVSYREGKCDSLHSLHKTYEEAYKEAKAYLCGEEPTDETRHH